MRRFDQGEGKNATGNSIHPAIDRTTQYYNEMITQLAGRGRARALSEIIT
jgi:hypothetical protein